MTAFELAAFDASRREAYLRLLRDAWGDRALDGEEFDWWFDGNPFGSLMSVAVSGGDVVGVAAHSLCRLSIGGRERLGQFTVHAVTDPSARGLGIFRALERRHEGLGAARGSAAVFAFASDSTREIFLGPLGYTRIDRRRVWGRPLRGAARGPRRASAVPLAPARADGLTRIAKFGSAQEEAYAAARPVLANHVVRSARYLDWRYLESPRGYEALTDGKGFGVLGRTERRGTPLALVMDLVAPPAAVGPLLGRLVAAASTTGAAAVLAVPSALVPRSLLARAGFLPLPVTLDFMGKALDGSLDPDPARWNVTFGDTDFF